MDGFCGFLLGMLAVVFFFAWHYSKCPNSPREQDLEEEKKRLQWQLAVFKEHANERPKYLENQIKNLKSELASTKNSLFLAKVNNEKLLDALYSDCIEIKIFESCLSDEAKEVVKKYARRGQTYENVLAEIINYTCSKDVGSLLSHLASEYSAPKSSLTIVETVKEKDTINAQPLQMSLEEYRIFQPDKPGDYFIEILDENGAVISMKKISIFSH